MAYEIWKRIKVFLSPGESWCSDICHECDFEGTGFIEITEAELDGPDADAPLALWYTCPICGHHNAYI